MAVVAQNQMWKESLFGCFNDLGSCILGFCFPCVQFGLNAEALDGSSCIGNCCLYYLCMQIGCCCLAHMPFRKTVRARYGLQPDCDDFCATCCCGPCAICQEAREIAIRGPPPTMAMGGQVYGQPVVYAQQQQYSAPGGGGYMQPQQQSYHQTQY